MRGTGCVGSQSLITNDLGDETVVGVRTNTDILVSGVVDDIQVDIIKSTDADEFTFSTAVSDFSLGGQGVFKFDLAVFLCRYGEEYNLSVQLFFNIFIGQSQGCTDDTGQLGMMSAAVSSLSLRIGIFMFWDAERIQFPDESQTYIRFLFFI